MHPAYQQLVQETDQMVARLATHYAAHLACRAGCSGCCHHHLSVFPVEAAALEEAIEVLPAPMRRLIADQADEVQRREKSGEPVACPLLVEDRCAVYAARPLICRTQGLPLLYEAEDGAMEVDACPLNFTAPDAVDDLDEEHLVPLDVLNLKLAAVNLAFCRTHSVPEETSGERITVAEIVKKKD